MSNYPFKITVCLGGKIGYLLGKNFILCLILSIKGDCYCCVCVCLIRLLTRCKICLTLGLFENNFFRPTL